MSSTTESIDVLTVSSRKIIVEPFEVQDDHTHANIVTCPDIYTARGRFKHCRQLFDVLLIEGQLSTISLLLQLYACFSQMQVTWFSLTHTNPNNRSSNF